MQTKTQGMRNVVDIASVRKANVVTSEGGFSGAEILAMDLPPISHIVSDMLTSGVYMLSGSPKVGKSFLALDMAVSISTGCEFLGHRVTQGTVLFFGLEDTIQTISQRLRMLYLHDGETNVCLIIYFLKHPHLVWRMVFWNILRILNDCIITCEWLLLILCRWL